MGVTWFSAGYTGRYCDKEVDGCASNPCIADRLSSPCTSSLGDNTCPCKPGYMGKRCETDVDDCSPSPCVNGVSS